MIMSCEFSALGLPKKTQRPVCNLYVFLKRILSFISSKASTPPLGFRLRSGLGVGTIEVCSHSHRRANGNGGFQQGISHGP